MQAAPGLPAPLRLANEAFEPLPARKFPPMHETVDRAQGAEGPPSLNALEGFVNTLNEALFRSEPFGNCVYYTSRGEGFTESLVNPASREYYRRLNRNPNDPQLFLAYTEEQKCMYWAWKASPIFYEHEEVTPARVREVDAMEEALRHVGLETTGGYDYEGLQTIEDRPVQRKQQTLAFLQQLSIPDNDLDGAGLRSSEGVPFGEDARFFWLYYLTCYCLILNEAHPRRRKPVARTDGWGRETRFNYGTPPPPPEGHALQKLVATPAHLEQTLYHLQYWFDRHLADSPVTKLAYGISERCGLRKAARNPALLRYEAEEDGMPQFFFANEKVRKKLVLKEPGEPGEAFPCPNTDEFVDEDDLFDDEEDPKKACRLETSDEAVERLRDLTDLFYPLPPQHMDDPRLSKLQTAYMEMLMKFPRFLYVFDDEEDWVEDINERIGGKRMFSKKMKYKWDDDERYVAGLHDLETGESGPYQILRADDRAATIVTHADFSKLMWNAGRNPVAVDLYKPLPIRYASYRAGFPTFAWDGSMASVFYDAQKRFWEARNAHPRHVFSQPLRTYFFDPYLASPERLVADLTYWHYRKLQTIATAQEAMRFTDAEIQQLNLRYYSDALDAFYEDGRVESLNSGKLTPYMTKLALEVADWHSRFDARTQQPPEKPPPRRYFELPFWVSLKFETDDGGEEFEKVDDDVRAWTEFQVGAWYRNAEYYATMYERQLRGDAPPPDTVWGNDVGYDFVRHTTKDKGARERAQSDRYYELRYARELAEYKRELREYDQSPVRCTPFDNIGVAESGMADAEKDDRDSLYARGLMSDIDYFGPEDDDEGVTYEYNGKVYVFLDPDVDFLTIAEKGNIKKVFPEAGVTMFGDVAYENALKAALEAKLHMIAAQDEAPRAPSLPFTIPEDDLYDAIRKESGPDRGLAERRRERREKPYGESVAQVFDELFI